MILLKKSFVEFSLDSSVPCVIAKWNGYAKSEEFRAFLNEALDIYKQKKIWTPQLSWLADTKGIGVISREDQEWLDKNWNLRLTQAGLRYMALIVPENVFGEMSVKTYSQKAESSPYELTTQMFDDLQKAKTWLTHMSSGLPKQKVS